MRILFISTHNLATNPRLVKEAELALQNGYDVTILCCSFDNWSKPIHDKILERLKQKATCHVIPGGRKPLLTWMINSVFFSAAGFLLKIWPSATFWLSVRSNKRSFLLLRYLKNLSAKADLVVAHNPGSFYPAKKFSKVYNIPFGVDLEDYHPGETNDETSAGHFRMLSKKILKSASYVSAASPLIMEYTLGDTGEIPGEKMTVLNYFPSQEFCAPVPVEDKRLQLVWFSQYISFGRGLEEAIPAIKSLADKVVLHLYGNPDHEFVHKWLEGVENIEVHPPMDQLSLHQSLAKYDAGLALENPLSNLNRELCITNKILSYFQAGLYIIGSATKAQTAFLNQYPEAGRLTGLSTGALREVLEDLHRQLANLRSQKNARYELANNFNWHHESQQLLGAWQRILTT